MIYVYPGSDHVFQTLMNDARNVDGIKIVDSLFEEQTVENRILKIRRQHRFLWKLFAHFVLRHFKLKLDATLKQENRDSVFVFSNISVRFVPISVLKQLKQNHSKLVLYFIDSISNVNSKEAFKYVKLKLFDIVYTFDKDDALKYNMTHFYTMFSRKFLPFTQENIMYDAIYIGSDKGRYKMLSQFKRKCAHSNIYVNMLNVTKEQLEMSSFQSNISIPYKDSLELVIKSNCIIDLVLDPEQSGLSLRTYEAIAFNKKLITNNKSIKDFPFYNSKYMFYFEKIDDIDEDFIKERIKVDYGYNDEYSPLAFINNIKKQLNYAK